MKLQGSRPPLFFTSKVYHTLIENFCPVYPQAGSFLQRFLFPLLVRGDFSLNI